MKEKILKLLFYLKRGTQSKEGKSPIMARLSVGRTMVQFSCKIACSPQLWDSRKSRLVGKSAEAVSVNAELDRLQLAVHRAFEYLQSKQGEIVTAEEVKATLFRLNSDSQGLLYHLEGYLARFRERVGIDRSERRYKCIFLFRKHFETFIKHRYRVGDLPVQKVCRALVEDFEAYLTREKAFKLNTTAGYLSMLASLLKDLYKRHIIDTYPFLGYSIRWDVGSPRYITKEELLRIIALDETQLGDYELVSRDMFVFACYTGLSYTDIYHLTSEHLVEEGGMTWIRKPRIKTGNVCHIPLLPEASTIIEQYRGIHTRAFRHEPPKGYLLPIPGCDTVNIHLKKMAKLCKINKCLTFHMARHTFASQMTLSEGVSIESVSKMLGHSQIKTTQVYAETSPERVFRDIERILPEIAHYRLTN
ncbi:site-specific integrase [Porphyromonas circumdentaria]|uniref:Site-specific recombinase XerD n=1 Tax=Porphyromonas circumdentaria TaxID=29524 RepID=A0A1T4KIT8_9PORP|nr:site-specific integrase [Porphyromonas circumdentaria]MBB6275029.1 integrase [Porphyromonas circumdentaria]SJZ42329.1 Site-specific recombinase XerD [Porphyromonas circumdentaria]